jgi:hypothetical protein
VPSYLIECYVPNAEASAAGGAARRARLVAEQLSRDGMSVRYLRTMFLPEDELCFHLFEADSSDVVVEVARRTEPGRFRLVSAVVEFEGVPS